MKIVRSAVAVLIAACAFTSSPRADGGDDMEILKCDCWYWQSNQHGMITETPNGPDCKVVQCSSGPEA